jgi:hypothetical protein
MKISAVFDGAGHIISAHEVKDVAGATTTLHQVPGPGQHQAVFEAPSNLATKKFSDFIHTLHVQGSAGKHQLVAK